jgi:hypothetical protein
MINKAGLTLTDVSWMSMTDDELAEAGITLSDG